MRKGYLLINNASTPLGEREFWKKKNITTKKKNIISSVFSCHGGNHQPQKEDTIALSLSPWPGAFDAWFRASFFLVGESVWLVFQNKKVFSCVKFTYS